MQEQLCDQELLKGEQSSGDELSLEEPAGNKLICAWGHVHFIATDVHRRAVHKREKKTKNAVKNVYVQPCESL